jgi:rhomboid protease GluP
MFTIFVLIGSTGIDDDVLVYGIFNANGVAQGMLWLLTTSTFIHFGIAHFFLNMLALYQIGFLVEQFYNSRKILIVYILGGIVGSIATFALSRLQGENIASLGASGAIFAMLGLLIGGTFKRQRYGASLPFTKESFYPTLVFAFLISFLPGINWMAHLGGFVAGVWLGYIFENSLIPFQRTQDVKLEKGLFTVSIGIFVVSYALLVGNLIFDFLP